MTEDDYLFSKYTWFFFKESRIRDLKREIASWDENRLLKTSAEDLCKYLVGKYRIDVPVLNRDGIIVDQRETEVDVSRDPISLYS